MHAVVRRYTGSSVLADAIMQRRNEVEEILRGVPGFISYYAVRDGDRLATITVCDDEAGTRESTRRAAAWVKENLASVSMSAPEVSEGQVILQFNRAPIPAMD